MVETLISLLASLILFSFIEYYVHGYILHQKNALPALLYRLFPAIEMERHEHSELHHEKYYKVFNHEPDPVGRDLAQRIGWKTTLVGLGFFLPWLALTALLISSVFPLVFIAVGLVYVLTWNTIHPEMHQPRHPWWSKLPPYRFLAQYHFVHHDNHRKKIFVNENLVLPFADFVFRRHRDPTPEQKVEMQKLGII